MAVALITKVYFVFYSQNVGDNLKIRRQFINNLLTDTQKHA